MCFAMIQMKYLGDLAEARVKSFYFIFRSFFKQCHLTSYLFQGFLKMMTLTSARSPRILKQFKTATQTQMFSKDCSFTLI